MRIVQFAIQNYLAMRDCTPVSVGKFNVLVGRNDVGKSAVLKALDLFLNLTTPRREHANVATGDSVIQIEASLVPNGFEIVVDEAVLTTFEAEELVDEDGRLQIRRTWDVNLSKAKLETWLFRKIYDDDDFFEKAEKDLIALCAKHAIETARASGDDFNNAEKRAKLRENYEARGVAFHYDWQKLPTTGKGRLKLVHDALKRALPRFEYFRADTSLTETDTAIQNYFRDVALEALDEVSTAKIEEAIKSKLGAVLNSISSRINRVVPEDERVVAELAFDWSKIVKTSFGTGDEDNNVPLRLRGDGFRRITMMSYFEHLAEERRLDDEHVIFGFEEPETFLHPKAQELLFEKLHDLSESGYQVFVSSHSPIIVASTSQQDLVHVTRIGGVSSVQNGVEELEPIADDLGITVDNQFVALFDSAKVLLLVEGIDDANALRHVCGAYKANNIVDASFDDLGIVLLPIGGCGSIKHWVSLKLLDKLSKPFFIFLDSDRDGPGSPSANAERLDELDFVAGVDYAVTKKRELENYIACDALNRMVPGASLNYGDWDAVKDICREHALASQLGGKRVARAHFGGLRFEELRSAFRDGADDEFVELFTIVRSKLA